MKRLKTILVLLAILMVFAPFAFGVERVVTVGGNNATRPITDFGINVVDVYYVDSGSGDDARAGTTPETCLDTLDAAIGKCTANQGDVIYLLPGHTETEATAAASIATMDVAGVTVIGLGEGSLMPTFNLGVADATFTISAADCRLQGVRIKSTVADVAVGLTLAATCDGTVVEGCEFRDDAANKEFLVCVSVAAAAHQIKIIGNDFRTTAAAGTNNAILSAAVTDLEVRDNVVFGKFATGAMLTSGVLTRGKIIGNKIINAEAAIAIALNGNTSTGILANNFLGGTTSMAAALTGDEAIWCFENYISGAGGASGVISPAVDAD